MARAASKPKKEISMEEALWKSADKLRGSVEPAEYKHVVLSLFFLKFASDKFEAQRKAISEKYGEKFVDNVAFYTKDNVFFLPEISRWSFIMENAKQDDIALKIDTALYTIEKANPALKGALPDNYYSRLHIDTAKLASLLDEIDKINTGDKENDIIGRVYEYFLSKFALAEGKGKGEFYTPKCIVNLIAEMIEPYDGILYDPCCGSGGMFVQSMKFVEAHHGNKKKVSIYGQEYTNTTYTLIQTISRVNRVYTGKDKGLIVDYIGIKKNMNLALKKYTNFETDEFEGVEQSVTIVKDQLDVLAQMFRNFNSTDYFNGSPKEQLACLNRAVEYVQLTEDLETRFMAAVKRMKQAFNLCSSSDAISDREKDYLHFYCAVRSILFKLTKGDAPDISQMNARVRELLEGAIQSDGIEELFETGKHISVDIFSDEYLDKINAIQLPNTKIKVLQRLLSQAIDEYKKVNRIMGMEFSDRLKRVVDEYNNRRRDEAFANEVLDDVAEQLAKLLEELKKEKDSFKGMGIDYEEKAFYDILKAVAKKYEFEYPDDKMIELSKRIKVIVDDKAKYTDWSTRDDIKANLQVDLILLLDEFDYPPVTIDDVYKEVLEQAENFKKYSE